MASRLLRRQVMTLTDAAAARVRELTAAAGKPIAGLRVGVKNGGCAGMSYTMELADAVSPHDEVVEDKGVKLLIDPKAILFLLGAQMDFKVDRLSATFLVLQSERDLGLRLRRKRRDHAREPRGAERAGLTRQHGHRRPEGAVRAVRAGYAQAHLRRRGPLCGGPVLTIINRKPESRALRPDKVRARRPAGAARERRHSSASIGSRVVLVRALTGRRRKSGT